MTPVSGVLVTPVTAIQYDGSNAEEVCVFAWGPHMAEGHGCTLAVARLAKSGQYVHRYPEGFVTVRDEPPATAVEETVILVEVEDGEFIRQHWPNPSGPHERRTVTTFPDGSAYTTPWEAVK